MNKDTPKGKPKQDRIKEKASEEQVSKAKTDKADLNISKVSPASRNPLAERIEKKGR